MTDDTMDYRGLMVAVLQQAVDDLNGTASDVRREHRSRVALRAARWLRRHGAQWFQLLNIGLDEPRFYTWIGQRETQWRARSS